MSTDYLKRILTSRVYDVAVPTPLEKAKSLSERTGNEFLLKLEDLQPIFSFKIRGAYNKMANLSATVRDRGVIAASAGNHAQGVALSAHKLGCRAVIVMPTTTPPVKIEAVRRFGAETVLYGESFSDAYEKALELEKSENLTFVHPFDDPDVIAGQGTIALEILHRHPDPIDAVFVAIGGGGLIAGVAAYIKQIRPEIKVIGVQTEDSDAMIRSVEAGRRVRMQDVGLFSDGTAVKQVGVETFRLTRELVDDFVRVNTDELCAAIRDVFQDTRNILEPAGALAIAGAKRYLAEKRWKGKTVVAIASGANMNFDRLRFVAERAEVGEDKEALFGVTLKEERGSFRRLCALIDHRNVTEFNYRMSDNEDAHVFIGVQISTPDEPAKIVATLEKNGFPTVDLTQNEMAKTHLRHMVGGRSDYASNELLYRFEFPERPGALMRFLSTMHPDWNISLFHYRNLGADFGRILVGIQVPPGQKTRFRAFLNELGYPHWNETDNPAYDLFLGGLRTRPTA
ncbi:threonine ammonia-lyase, biosynthetic [Orrella sp. 11846]|uniref:threonine ammonia-lyase, biosynthetic n=1 Tax=Orrella sp. 11846 TaxID=3409913 RepID=UPI003B5A239E